MLYNILYMVFILIVAGFSFIRGYQLGKNGVITPLIKLKTNKKSREEQILDNIEAYDGTNANQRPVRG